MDRENEIFQQEVEEFLCLSSDESEQNDLSYWEFINSSDADSDDLLDDGDDDGIDELSVDSGLCVSWHSSASSSAITVPQNTQFDAVLDNAGVGFVEEEDVSYMANQYHTQFDAVLGDFEVGFVEEEDASYMANQYHQEDEYEYDHDDYDDDLDDELVPWSVSGKLGRQRMRKLGKRACAKMNYSKKSPFLYMKPGAVHGKHGLGMKHSF
ncbi:FK506-binding protein 3-like [Melia azedarach]|uniref:FK506-binding protein 3-like n=1 Tax=Melia azedarach TaxID=155640 RepID=A0ACC1XYR6_MELAZ|nr:FK506-binding protein 3-like [Melia azedarach]